MAEHENPDLPAGIADLSISLNRGSSENAESSEREQSGHGAATDSLTARALDYAGMGFLLVPPEILVLEIAVSKAPVDWPVVIPAFVGCYIIGPFLLALGLNWKKIKQQLPTTLTSSIVSVANNAFVWLIVCFIFAFGPPLLVAVAQHSSQTLSQAPLLPTQPFMPVAPPSFPQRSQADAEKERVVIDRVLDILKNEAMPQTDKAREFVSGWWNALIDPSRNQSYGQDFENLIVDIGNTNGEINSVIQDSPQFCNFDLCSIALSNASFTDLLRHLSDLQASFAQMRIVNDPNKLKQIETNFPPMKYLFDTAENDIIAYKDWISETEDALQKRRAKL